MKIKWARLNTSICSLILTSFFLSPDTLAGQIEPNAGQWKTWILNSASKPLLPEPPGLFETLKECGQMHKEMRQRSAADLDTIRYWDAGSPGYRWYQIAMNEISQHKLAPPLATRALALLGASIYDTTVVTWNVKYSYARKRPRKADPFLHPVVADRDVPSYPSEHASTAAVASRVLSYLFPDDAATLNQLAEQAAESRVLAGANYPSDVDAGMQLGQKVADQVILYAKNDGSDAVFTGSFPSTPGVWSGMNPTTPLAGQWKPWVLSSGSEFRAPPPPAFGSSEESGQIEAVKNVNRTAAVLNIVWFWQPGFIAPWLDILNTKIFEYRLDDNAPRAARAYSLGSIAMHDAVITRFESAYTYRSPRPPQADSSISPAYSLPSNPSYPAAHSAVSAGIETVLSYLFPADALFFRAKAIEAGESTFEGGIHFQIDVDAGLTQGHSVGTKVVERALSDGSL